MLALDNEDDEDANNDDIRNAAASVIASRMLRRPGPELRDNLVAL